MSATQTYEDYLRGQVERGQYGVAIIQAQIALDIAEYIEKHRQPTIEPERKVGKWIKHIDDLFPAESTIECSKCHHEQPLTIDSNFCPNCGEEMEEDNNL